MSKFTFKFKIICSKPQYNKDKNNTTG